MKIIRLENATIAKPCPTTWSAMSGGVTRRSCALCERDVHNLSALTVAEAERLLNDSGGRLCVAFTRDAGGRIVTIDRPASARLRTRLPVAAFAVLLGIAQPGLTSAATLPGITSTGDQRDAADLLRRSSYNGALVGTIVDSTGEPLPDVKVTAVDKQDPNRRFTTTTGAGGRYRLSVPVGGYSVTYVLEGFRDEYWEDARVGASFEILRNITLSVGGLVGEVIIVEQPSALERLGTTVLSGVKRLLGKS